MLFELQTTYLLQREDTKNNIINCDVIKNKRTIFNYSLKFYDMSEFLFQKLSLKKKRF